MARMREPFTGGVFDVPAPRVARYLGRGYALLDGEPVPDAAEDETDERTAEMPVADVDEPRPTADSTITEIRAWARAHGVALPKRGNKAALLSAIG